MRLLFMALLVVLAMTSSPQASAAILESYSQGSGTAFSGWTWRYDPGRQNQTWSQTVLGWSSDNGSMVNGGWLPRLMQKRDNYTPAETSALGEISTVTTPLGDKTLHIYEPGGATSQTGGPGWWFLYHNTLGARGITNNTTNRLDFYIRLNGMTPFDPMNPVGGTLHFGTYVCWNDGTGAATERCPNEANPSLPQWWRDQVSAFGGTTQAGQHYYHYPDVNGSDNAWVHVQLDQHPGHARQAANAGEPENDPTYVLFGKHYFESLISFYLEIRYKQAQLSEYWVGPFNFSTQTETQNEESITSPWVGYYPSTGKWEIGFQDPSFKNQGYGNTTQSTFEIRWSSSPITNENFSSATIIEPEYWESGTTNRIRRANTWRRGAWTRFDLPSGLEAGNDKIYFAIKDVSSTTNGDGHNSPSPYIRTIDYTLRTGSASCSDGEQNQGETNVDCGGPCAPCDTTAPIVTLFSMPSTATALSVPVTSLTASDTVGVTGYTITESSSAPAAGAPGWSATAPTSFTFSGAGTRTAYAWAKDAAGNISASLIRTVTITLSDTTAPSVSISSPASQATLKGTVTVSATATDNAGVTKVDFFVDGSLIGSDSSSPYNISWNTTSLSSGAHILAARAYDAAGNVTTSTQVSVALKRVPKAPLIMRLR